MPPILIAIIIGIIAGTIDVIPMILMKLEKTANISAFLHYLVLGIIIPFVDWQMAPWLKGIIISTMAAIPVMLMTSKNDRKSAIPIFVFSIVLGAGIGFTGGVLIE